MKTRLALWLAGWINRRACEIQRELHDHIRNETRRVELAGRRVRGLRLYAAWSAPRQKPVADPAPWHHAGLASTNVH